MRLKIISYEKSKKYYQKRNTFERRERIFFSFLFGKKVDGGIKGIRKRYPMGKRASEISTKAAELPGHKNTVYITTNQSVPCPQNRLLTRGKNILVLQLFVNTSLGQTDTNFYAWNGKKKRRLRTVPRTETSRSSLVSLRPQLITSAEKCSYNGPKHRPPSLTYRE